MIAIISDVDSIAVLEIQIRHGGIQSESEIQDLFQFVSDKSSIEFPNQRLRLLLENALHKTGLPE